MILKSNRMQAMLKSKRVLAMDIGASELKLAEFSFGKSGIEVLKIAVRSFGIDPGSQADTAAEIVLAIQDVIRERKIRPAPVVLSMTGQSAFLRLVRLPPVKRSRIYQTVQYEALQNVPFPIAEVVWDYQLMGSSQTELNVMIVAIKTDIVENITGCVVAAGLDLELVDVVPMALYNAVRYNYGEFEGCTLIIDMGARATNLVFLEKDRFFSRTLPIVGTGNAITQQLMKEFNLSFHDAEELKRAHASVAFGGAYEDHSDMVISKVSKTVRSAMTRLHVEVERSINFYRNQQGGTKPARVLLAGGTCVIARMDDFFREKLRITDVEYLNAFKNVLVHEAISTEDISACAHVMGGVVGVGLRHALPCPLEINLLPPKIVAEKEFRGKQPYFIAAAVSLALIGLCWFVFFSQMSRLIEERKNKVQSQVGKLEVVESQLITIEEQNRQLQMKADTLGDLVYFRTEWIAMLDSVHSCMLDGMWLTSVVPLSGKALDPMDVAQSATATIPAPEPEKGFRPRRRRQIGNRPVYTHIQINGMIFADKATDKSIALFRDKLRKSPCFREETEIRWVSLLHQDDYARGFTVEIALKTPLM